MPTIKVYIRNEDLELWRAVPKKAEFIHDSLNSIGTIPVKTSAKVESSITVDKLQELDISNCKHGKARKDCDEPKCIEFNRLITSYGTI